MEKGSIDNDNNNINQPSVCIITEGGLELVDRHVPNAERTNSDIVSVGELKIAACHAAGITHMLQYVLVTNDTGERWKDTWEVPALFGDETVYRLVCVSGLDESGYPPLYTAYQSNAGRIMKRSYDKF